MVFEEKKKKKFKLRNPFRKSGKKNRPESFRNGVSPNRTDPNSLWEERSYEPPTTQHMFGSSSAQATEAQLTAAYVAPQEPVEQPAPVKQIQFVKQPDEVRTNEGWAEFDAKPVTQLPKPVAKSRRQLDKKKQSGNESSERRLSGPVDLDEVEELENAIEVSTPTRERRDSPEPRVEEKRGHVEEGVKKPVRSNKGAPHQDSSVEVEIEKTKESKSSDVKSQKVTKGGHFSPNGEDSSPLPKTKEEEIKFTTPPRNKDKPTPSTPKKGKHQFHTASNSSPDASDPPAPHSSDNSVWVQFGAPLAATNESKSVASKSTSSKSVEAKPVDSVGELKRQNKDLVAAAAAVSKKPAHDKKSPKKQESSPAAPEVKITVIGRRSPKKKTKETAGVEEPEIKSKEDVKQAVAVVPRVTTEEMEPQNQAVSSKIKSKQEVEQAKTTLEESKAEKNTPKAQGLRVTSSKERETKVPLADMKAALNELDSVALATTSSMITEKAGTVKKGFDVSSNVGSIDFKDDSIIEEALSEIEEVRGEEDIVPLDDSWAPFLDESTETQTTEDADEDEESKAVRYVPTMNESGEAEVVAVDKDGNPVYTDDDENPSDERSQRKTQEDKRATSSDAADRSFLPNPFLHGLWSSAESVNEEHTVSTMTRDYPPSVYSAVTGDVTEYTATTRGDATEYTFDTKAYTKSYDTGDYTDSHTFDSREYTDASKSYDTYDSRDYSEQSKSFETETDYSKSFEDDRTCSSRETGTSFEAHKGKNATQETSFTSATTSDGEYTDESTRDTSFTRSVATYETGYTARSQMKGTRTAESMTSTSFQPRTIKTGSASFAESEYEGDDETIETEYTANTNLPSTLDELKNMAQELQEEGPGVILNWFA